MRQFPNPKKWAPDRRRPSRRMYYPLLVILALAGYAVVALAAPQPPRWVVDHQAKKCAQIVPGDECGDIVLPPGWEYLDSGECPEDYQRVDLGPEWSQFEWVHFKMARCCTEGHYGVSGDCEDVVIQSQARQCAFVDDIRACASLPDSWLSLGKDCPADYTWVEALSCDTDTSQSAMRETVAKAGSSSATSVPAPSQTAGGSNPVRSIDVCTNVAPLGLLLLVTIAIHRVLH